MGVGPITHVICISARFSPLAPRTRSASVPPRMNFMYLPIKYVYSIYVAIAFDRRDPSPLSTLIAALWNFLSSKKKVFDGKTVSDDETPDKL